MIKQVKTPSKFISFERLEIIRLNNYIAENGYEYHASEIDDLISIKQRLLDDKDLERQIDRYEAIEAHELEQEKLIQDELDKQWLMSLVGNN